MSRSYSIFLALMIGIGVLIGAAYWWLGPRLINLALFDPNRHAPYTVLTLTASADPAYRTAYHQPLLKLITEEAGEVLGEYQLHHVLEGREQDARPFLRALQFAQATDWVQVLTAPAYRNLGEDLADLRVTQLSSFVTPSGAWRDALVVFLTQLRPRDDGQFGADELRGLLQSLPDSGRVVWDAYVEMLQADADVNWQRVVVVDFDHPRFALEWLRQPQVETERALIKAQIRELGIVVYRRAIEPVPTS